jgi:hypothetical protein
MGLYISDRNISLPDEIGPFAIWSVHGDLYFQISELQIKTQNYWNQILSVQRIISVRIYFSVYFVALKSLRLISTEKSPSHITEYRKT